MKIIVSADNAGGANAILPVVKKLLKNGHNLTIVLGGAAKSIFKDAKICFYIGEKISDRDLKKMIRVGKYDYFLAGTSLGDTIDKKIRRYCEAGGVPTIYVMDTWVNYWWRFGDEIKKNDFLSSRTYICVVDDKMKKEMIAEGFPASRIKITGNPYFNTFTKDITDKKNKKNKILFISQKLKNNGGQKWPYDEFVVLEDLLKVLEEIILPHKLMVRLHPQEKQGKFDYLLSRYKFSYDKMRDVKKSLSSSGLVIGMNSVVLFQAALAGKKVISYQPYLRGKDCLVSNRMGLSKLVTDKDKFTVLLKKYFRGEYKIFNKKGRLTSFKNYFNRQAVNNIIKIILGIF